MTYSELLLGITAFIIVILLEVGLYHLSLWSGACEDLGGPSWVGQCRIEMRGDVKFDKGF